MRDVVTLFIEASVAKGEWQAALSALKLPRASQSSSSSTSASTSAGSSFAAEVASNLFRLSSALSSKGVWMAALAVLRDAPLPFAARGRKPYSSAYLAARVRAYQHVLTACCSGSSAAAVGNAAAVTRPTASARAGRGGTEDMSFECALALAEEAFCVFGSAPGLCGRGKSPCEEPAGRALTKPLVAPVAASSVESDAGTACVEDLLRWCRAELPRRRSCTGVTTLEQTEAAIQQLTALSDAALRGISDAHVVASHRPSSEPGNKTVSDPHADSLYARAASDVQRAEDDLTKLLASNSQAADAWATSLTFLRRLPAECVSGHLFTAFLRHLLQHNRRGEVAQLVRTLVLLHRSGGSAQGASPALTRTPPSRATARVLRLDSVVIKVVAEACHRLRRSDLAAELLLDTEARAAMTPSAAVPLVMTLRDAGAYSSVLLWWELLRREESALRYPLLKHAKLSSYVASCVLRNTTAREGGAIAEAQQAASSSAAKVTRARSAALWTGDWRSALDAFRDAAAPAHDPALVLLFQLRLLRQAGQWEAAVQLFNAFCQTHPGMLRSKQSPSDLAGQVHDGRRDGQHRWRTHREAPCPAPGKERASAMKSACAVLTQEHAEQWIPSPVLVHLKQQVQDLKP
ncbi:conserved hypothetical protein [Leishmania infantum JPCM5]|uniref:Uncharacterized protein n=2 Tax=Leishmania infantum TaxID=5671 RepID=A4I923_LEIIN|nr:conserved hypothetical protein [Leishmania infantum JPCM5]CAC9532117.1 hypothetical_protein_-_conserved [Leishmania infantum]CAM71323.1 conserved hypothetical protein [Leishmania infantum JPCM5]SUZ45165.1 hypothetical_protein_-_conserved [Leishmania infantum]|eukprot:XP_001468242.1 conserved hypothetical protein [Leishmania infantum JPCM5]